MLRRKALRRAISISARRPGSRSRLGEPLAADAANSRAFSLRRIGEDAQRLMSYHPLVVGELMLVNNHSQIFAFDRHTGEPAWPGDPARPEGEIYADENARTGDQPRQSRAGRAAVHDDGPRRQAVMRTWVRR